MDTIERFKQRLFHRGCFIRKSQWRIHLPMCHLLFPQKTPIALPAGLIR
jgi:hypothetical protein